MEIALTHGTVLLTLALIFGFYMAWNIGANDVANAMGTSVGSRALTLKQAVIAAAILEFLGAFLVGAHVSGTVRKGIVDPAAFGDPNLFVYGMLGALLAAGVWLQIASYFGWPVSTTHSIVGAIVGIGVVVAGVEAVQWGKVGQIVSSWVVSPLLSGTLSFCIFMFIRKNIFNAQHPVEAAKKWTPYMVFPVFMILTMVLLFKGLKNLNLDFTFPQALGIAMVVGIISALISAVLVRRIKVEEGTEVVSEANSPQVRGHLEKALKQLQRAQVAATPQTHDELADLVATAHSMHARLREEKPASRELTDQRNVERIFIYLQIISACFVAFAHGANDVANAIGPLAAVLSVVQTGVIGAQNTVPLWVLALGGVGIVIGLATWGWRVMETIGKKITELTPSRGFAAEFGAAATIVVASRLSLPISTTHTLVGAVLGVGLARGMGALNLKTIRDIVVSWVITIPAGALFAIIFFYIFKAIFS
ncbi:MAG: PiT family inorganic phosphate transporter [Rhodothermales bacterium]|jgi:PiT family inorganic phosphate transporter